MSTEQHHSPATTRIILFWRKIQVCYEYANILSHHVLGALLKTSILAYFLFCVLFLTLRYAVLPNVSKPYVEQVLSHEISQPVSIGTLQASWGGLRPRLVLGNVKIQDKSGRDALTLPRVSAEVSWWSIMGTLRLYYLEIDRPDLDIQRDADGNLYVAGMLVPTKGNNDGKGLDWLLLQREIVIHDGRLRWNDNQRNAPELLLNDVNLELHNHWQHHQFAIKATPPSELAGPLDLRATFVHPFARRSSDPTLWKGELYADLPNAALAAWKAYVAYPLEVQQGHGSVRAWLDFDHARVADFTADLNLADTAFRLQKDLPMLDLDRLSGRVSVREEIDPLAQEGVPTFGSNGHTVTLTNFSMQTKDGLVLPPTTISESFELGKNGEPPKTAVSATILDLQTLSNIATRLPLSADQRELLDNVAPHGQLRNFSAHWQGVYPAFSNYDIKGQFTGLSLKAEAARQAKLKSAKQEAQGALPYIPGIENLTGQVAVNDRGGIVDIDSQKFKVNAPGIFSDPDILFDKLALQVTWVYQDKGQYLVQINNLDIVQDGVIASLNGTYQSPPAQQRNKSLGVVDLSGSIAEFDVTKIEHYIPTQADPLFRSWITGALVGGHARDVAIRVKGDLKDFPFNTQSVTEKPKGEFTVAGKIVDGVLNYAPNNYLKDGKSPIWPLLEDIQGTISFDRTRMEINAEHARTHNVALSNVKAVLPDFAPPKDVLEIDGTAIGPLDELVGYTKDSIVLDMIGGFTKDTKATGSAKLNLKLQLPLHEIVHSKVLGKIQFANNEINLFPGLPQLTSTTGQLEFTERGLSLNGVHANFLGGPVTVSGGGPAEATIIKAEGILTADGLQKYASGASRRLAQHVSGSTRYDVTINVKKSRADVIVNSNLQGLASDLPAPLHKEAGELLPTKFDMIGLASLDPSIAREEIKLTLGAGIVARYEREKPVDKNAVWHMARGGIGVNAVAAAPTAGLLLNVNMKMLNVDTWLDLFADLSSADKVRENGAADVLDLSEFIAPNVLAAHTTEMIIFKRKLDNVVLGASLEKDVWQANIDASQVSGYVTYSAKADQGKGKVTANLSSLIIPQEEVSEVTELLRGKNATSDLPALDIKADNFDLFGQHLGRLELAANNVHRANSNEWQIKNLVVSNPDATLKVTKGNWISRDGDSRSSLTYSMELNDGGRLLTRLGFPGLLNGGKDGKMDGDISWNGAPYSLDYASMSGNLHLDMGKGQFLKEGPGAAKLLGVLSLQSLPRRLTLDFRDIFSDGFAFDGVTMDATINKGVFSTDNLKMHGLDAIVLLDGSADINKETQNMHVAVIPQLDVTGASVAYGFLVNPVIGVGSFLAQLFLKAPLAKALTHEYQITGPWKEPVVTKYDRKSDLAAQPTTNPTTHTVTAQ
jgi:uncharacterized protein (TIGR02099 family)